MYGQNNQYGGGGGQYHGQAQYQQQGPTYHKPFVTYGVDSNQRPAVVSQGGCCCSIMWFENFFIFKLLNFNKIFNFNNDISDK